MPPTACRSRTVRLGSTGNRQDPGRTFKNKKMAGHMGAERVTTQNLKVVRTDVERGLILVEGSVPGSKGGWILVRDAVKRKAPEGLPMPGSFKKPVAVVAATEEKGGRVMELQIKTLDGADAGSITLSDEIFGLEPRADLIQRVVKWQLAKRRAGTHKTKTRSEIARTGKKMYKQKGTGGARHGSQRAPIFRGGGRAHGPVVRSHEHDLPKKVRALGLKHALSAKLAAGSLIVLDQATAASPKTKAVADQFEKARFHQRVGDCRRRGGRELRPRGPQHSERRRPAGSGHQRLRHPASPDARPDQGRGRRDRSSVPGGGVTMAIELSHYDVIRSPVITEKATIAAENNQVVFNVARTATKPEIKAAVEALFKVEVKSVNTLVRKGKVKRFKGFVGKQNDVKKAIVTLAEGHRIDITTGL